MSKNQQIVSTNSPECWFGSCLESTNFVISKNLGPPDPPALYLGVSPEKIIALPRQNWLDLRVPQSKVGSHDLDFTFLHLRPLSEGGHLNLEDVLDDEVHEILEIELRLSNIERVDWEGRGWNLLDTLFWPISQLLDNQLSFLSTWGLGAHLIHFLGQAEMVCLGDPDSRVDMHPLRPLPPPFRSRDPWGISRLGSQGACLPRGSRPQKPQRLD